MHNQLVGTASYLYFLERALHNEQNLAALATTGFNHTFNVNFRLVQDTFIQRFRTLDTNLTLQLDIHLPSSRHLVIKWQVF